MRIAAVQHALPGRRITNEWILARIREQSAPKLPADTLARLEGWVRAALSASGTEVRYALADGERAIDVLREAARGALAQAAVPPEAIDFLIYTGVGRGWLEPASASALQHDLALSNATCFDVMEACASWLRAMQIAHCYLRTGVYRRGMIVNCECGLYRRYADFDYDRMEELEHRFAQYTIGEAATATIVTDDVPDDDFHFTFRSFGEYLALCMIPLPAVADFLPGPVDPRYVPGRFIAHSRELLEKASTLIVETFASDPELRRRAYDVCFGHEASARVTDAVTRRLGVHEAAFVSHRRFGNTVSASVPLGMSVAVQEGRLRRGDRVLVIMGSAGMSIGFCAFTF